MRERVIRLGPDGFGVQADDWTFVGAPTIDAATNPGTQAPARRCVVPLEAWKRQRGNLRSAGEPVGVWLSPADDPNDLAADLDFLPFVAVHFPKATDGRGYSTASLLRTRLGFRGELRAFGDVGRDQLFLLRRCGFDSFRLAPHRDPHAALAGLQDFSVRYQGSVDDPLPLFRKRLAAQGTFASGHASSFGQGNPYFRDATAGLQPPVPRRAVPAEGGDDSPLPTARKQGDFP